MGINEEVIVIVKTRDGAGSIERGLNSGSIFKEFVRRFADVTNRDYKEKSLEEVVYDLGLLASSYFANSQPFSQVSELLSVESTGMLHKQLSS